MKIIKYIWYYFFWFLVRTGLRFYFTKVKVSGLENIPKNKPIIFGSNHENAFIDALLITTSNTRFDHYLVRAGVFKNSIARALLNSLNLMPVYRAQDGVNPLVANQQIFKACYEALEKKYAVMLFPEGEHNIRRHRRVLKKGLSRIALGAVNYEGDIKEVYVVPVGVNYSDHTGFRSAVHVVFGEPIVVGKQEENAENYNKLTAQMTEALSKVHVSLDRDQYLGLDAVLFHDLDAHRLIDPHRVNGEADQLQGHREEIKAIANQREELEASGLIFPFRPTSNEDLFWMFLLSPLALIGLLVNLPVLVPVYWFVKTKIREIEFVASLKFGFALLGMCVWWWLLGSWIFDYTEHWWLGLTFVSMVPLSLLALNGFLRKWKRNQMTRRLEADPALKSKYHTFVERIKTLREESI